MAGTFLFYDLETTGLNPVFDQILQFAAVRTDRKLNELEHHAFGIRVRPDVIPSPGAAMTHRIRTSDLSDAMCEYEAVLAIHQLVNTPETISIGYNSIGFDDDFLRFSFYRNLLPPYRHQYDNGCFRMDVFPITLIYRLFQPLDIIWPEIEGKPTLKLEHLAAANQLAEGRAHDAMTDVRATLALTRRFHAKTDVWDYVAGNFDKNMDRNRLDGLPERVKTIAGAHRLGLAMSHRFGSDNNYLAPVLSVGGSNVYKNQSLWLRLDVPDMVETTPDTIPDTTWALRRRLGEPPFILPIKERFKQRLTPESIEQMDVSLDWIQAHPDLFREVIAYHREFRYPDVPRQDLDGALYKLGFMPKAEEMRCRAFHAADLEKKAACIDRFTEPETRKLAVRLMGRNYPERLSPVMKAEFHRFMARVCPENDDDALVDYRGNTRLTPNAAIKEIRELRSGETVLTTGELDILDELEEYLTTCGKDDEPPTPDTRSPRTRQ